MLHTKPYQKSISFPKKLLATDPFSARALISHAAHLGLSDAQVYMGNAYSTETNDLQVPPDSNLAAHYHLLAIIGGQSESSFALASLLKGPSSSLPANESAAFILMRLAAVGGHAPAYYELGTMYEQKGGDMRAARAWYLKAAASGNMKATRRLDALRDHSSLRAFAEVMPKRGAVYPYVYGGLR
jgi:TPR repeat protein